MITDGSVSRGIDYGYGRTNVDRSTGIRYGVISAHDVGESLYESLVAYYGDPFCPKCASGALPYEDMDEDVHGDEMGYETYRHSCADYFCKDCKLILGSEYVFRDEPLSHHLEADGYEAHMSDDNELVITKSPYYTSAQFCSPCMPGGGHLGHPLFEWRQVRFPRSKKARIRRKWAGRESNFLLMPYGVRTYCLGGEWFDGDRAPYPVYSVATRKPVAPFCHLCDG